MKKRIWLLAAAGAAFASLVPVLGATTSASTDPTSTSAGPGLILKFNTMAPVTGPYVGQASPVRGVPGGAFPWILTAGTGILQQDGHLLVHVRGLVLADQAPVPPALRGTNPIPDFQAIVSCQTISSSGAAAIANVATGEFPASTRGNADINATVTLPSPCIAPVVFVTSPTGLWFAATGS